MEEGSLIVIDSIRWKIDKSTLGKSSAQPLCPKHHLRLRPDDSLGESFSSYLYCAEGHGYKLKRTVKEERAYVIDRIDAKAFRNMKVINLDDEAIPLATKRIDNEKVNPFWIEAKLVESKIGKRIVIYAGDKNRKNKTQVFIEPDIKRVSFDQKDHHPMDVFCKVEATFEEGIKASEEKIVNTKNGG